MNTARFVLLATLASTSICRGAVADSNSGPGLADVPAKLDPWLDDLPTKLEPLRPRAESDEDRTLAAAQVAVGRIYFQREQLLQALHCFQRAFRYDPASIAVLTDIVPLQLALSRHDEAARYAVIGVHQQATDVDMMRRLALFLTENLDFEGALKLYQKSVNLDLDAKNDLNAASLLEMGRLYYLTQQFELAAKAFDVVMPALNRPEKYGIDAKTHKRILGRADLTYALIGESYLEIGRGQDAAEMFRKANEAQNDESKLAFRLARVDVQAGRHQPALQHLQTYLDAKSDEEGSRPYELLYDLLAKIEPDPDAAQGQLLVQLRILRENDPTNRELAFFLADQLRLTTQHDEALVIYRETLETGADMRGYLGLVDILREREQVDELLDVLGKVTSQLGTLEPLGDQSVRIVENKQLLDKIIQAGLVEDTADEPGKTASVRLACGLFALQAEQHDQADKLFQKALTATEENREETVLVWILELFSAGRYDRAADLLQQAIDDDTIDVTNPYIFFLLAGALEMDNRTDQAQEAARKAVAIQPDAPQWRSREAWILYHARRFDEAYDKYESLVKDFDEDHSTTQRRETLRDARIVLSNIAVLREDFDTAEEWLEQVLDEFPADIGALNDLGYLYVDRGKHLRRSLGMAQRAVEAEPGNVAYQDSVGWALYKLGRHDDALEYLERASRHENPDGVILDHLGDVYWQLGRRDQAIEAWERAVSAMQQSENKSLQVKISRKIERREKLPVESP